MNRRAALVTGASRGIGRAIALALAQAGFDVGVGFHTRSDAARAVVAEIGETGATAIPIQGDLADARAATQVVEDTVDRFGRLDVMVANAGQLSATPLLEVSGEEYDQQLDTNARGSFFAVQAAGRQMVEQGDGGRIVIVSSDAAVRAYRGLSAYCMSKAAAKMLAETAAIELAPHGITVNCVAPGTTETDLNREALADPEQREMLLGSILLGRPGEPRYVADAVAFLVSARAGFITGATLAVDGGAAIH